MVTGQTARQYYAEREARRRGQREQERAWWLRRVREAVPDIARRHAGIKRVYLFGSLTQPGRFRGDSDIDVAVESDSPEVESAFWRDLERALGREVDVRSWSEVAGFVHGWEEVYGREGPASGE
ncbi:MAG: nucleotidyltransferase family protein [Chloroflexia bacterium]